MDPLLTKFEKLVERLEKSVNMHEDRKDETKPEHVQPGNPLLAQIASKGTGISKELKPVEKKPEVKKQEVKAVKPPTITENGPKKFYENHVDANIVLKESDVTLNDAYFIRDSKNCTFDFQGKIKNIFLEKCTNVKVTCKVLSSCKLL